MSLEVVRLDAGRRPDFWRVHCEANDAGWCNCIAWWVPTWEGWGERTAEENRALRERLFDGGEYDGYLLLDEGEPVGWCQCGPRDRLRKLCEQYGLGPDPEMWAITCFLLAPAARGRGLARALLSGVLQDLAARRVRAVQAFPERGEGLPADDVWTGPEALFAHAGFSVVREHPDHPVLGRSLGEGAPPASILD